MKALQLHVTNPCFLLAVRTPGSLFWSSVYDRGPARSPSLVDIPEFSPAAKNSDLSFRVAAAGELKVYAQNVHAQWFKNGKKLIMD